jgi:hypothetical protein
MGGDFHPLSAAGDHRQHRRPGSAIRRLLEVALATKAKYKSRNPDNK